MTKFVLIEKLVFLKSLISEHLKETESEIAKKILLNFDNQVKNFKQICPKEMLDKLLPPGTSEAKPDVSSIFSPTQQDLAKEATDPLLAELPDDEETP